MVLHVATPINQLVVGVARQVKIVTRLALFGTKLRRALTVAAIIAIGAATGPAPAFALVITVSNTADSGAGSLRAALASANNGDTIDATGVSGTITLASGLSVAKSLTILGPGANVLTVSGNNAGFRVFYIEAHTPSTTSTIDGITITSGQIDDGFYGGAGIFNNDATLTLRNCTVSNCSVSYGGNGGGIYNTANGTLTIVNTTIAGNHATAIGAIWNSGAMEIDSSTISGNTAYSVSAIGNNGALTILNSTFSGNSATLNGAISVCGLVGGPDYHMAGTLRIGSTILNGSSLGAGSSSYPCPDSVTSLGYNLSSDAEGGDGTTGPGGFLNATGDIRNTNPLLGPLQNNGGPTLTHAPLCGSPAIDAGKNFSVSATDQRGAPRTFDYPGIANATGGDGTNIGAVESPVSVFTVLNTNDSGAGSLRQAIQDANASPGSDIIDFGVGVTGTITLTSGELLITDCLFIDGPGATKVAVSGNAASRVFHVGPGIDVTIAGLTVTNGHVSGFNWGGGIFNDSGTLTVSNCTVSGNSAFNGGGITSTGGAMLSVIASTINGNSAANSGGGIHRINGPSMVINSTFSDNSAGGGVLSGGGGIFNLGLLRIINSTLSGNSATYGGGILNYGIACCGTLEIGSTILQAGTSGANISYFGTDVAFTSLGYNLSSDDASAFLNQSTDQNSTDPLLGPLQLNGGQTPTHALLCGSPAIDKGKNLSGETTDQRGLSRLLDNAGIANAVGGDGTDIGAFELQNSAPVAQCKQNATTLTAGANCTVTLTPGDVDDGSYDPDDDTITMGVSPASLTGIGSHTVTLTVTDCHGASSTCMATVTVADTTPPSLGPCPVNQSVTASSIAGAVATFATPTATDNCSVSVSCDHASGGTFPLGSTQVTCTAVDGSGNSVQCSFTVNVTYSWAGFLQPINADGTSVFKLGSTVPVKFQLTGASAGTANAVAKLSYTKIGNGAGTVNEALSTAAADAGNTFRYDATSGQYIFNWSTKGLTSGSYQLKVDLGDGVSRTVNLSSK